MINENGIRIIELRKEGKSLNDIQKIVKCSKSTISKYINMSTSNTNLKDELLKQYNQARTKEKLKQREIDLLKCIKPNDPSWFNDYKLRLREATKSFIVSLGGGECIICGYDRCNDSLIFHHIDPSLKSFALSGMRLTYNLLKIVNEAKKCCLLCSNCHGEYHAGVISQKLKPIAFNGILPESVIEWYVTHKKLELAPGVGPGTS